MVALIIIVVLVLWICVSCIKIVPQAQAYVIERLGAYQSTWNVGFNLKIPFIDNRPFAYNQQNALPPALLLLRGSFFLSRTRAPFGFVDDGPLESAPPWGHA